MAVELVNDAIKHAFLTLGYAAATSDQDKAVRVFLQGKDVFVSLPTGEGKFLCFATLPAVFDCLKRHLTVCTGSPSAEQSTICVVVSPLTSLMKDQVVKFSERGLKCAYVGR